VIDFIILIIILLGVWRGLMAGAVRTAVSLVAWIFALVMGSSLAAPLAPLFVSFTDSQMMQIALAFLAVAFVILIFGQIVVYILVKTLKLLRLGFLDKLLGGVLGAVKGLIKVLIILSVMSPVLVHLSSFQNASLAQSLLPFAPIAKQLAIEVVGELKDVVDEHEQ
jgi:membrane protein required for colicin V production